MVNDDDLDCAELHAALAGAETALARPVNPSLMSREEWRRKRAEVDSFNARIVAQPKLAEYKGHPEHDGRLSADLLTAAKRLLEMVEVLAGADIGCA